MANKRTRSQAKGAASKTPEARNESGAGAESSSHGINNSHSASSSSSMSALIGTLTNHTASSSSPSAPTPHPTLSTSSSSSASSSQGGRSAQEPSSIGSGHTIDLSTAGLPQVVACVTCFARPVFQGSIVCVPCAEAQVQRLQAGARAQEEIKVSSSSAGSFSMSAEALQWAIGRTAVASNAPPTSVVSHGLVMPLAQDPSFSHSGNHRFGSSASIPASSGLVRPAAASGKREVLDSANDESSEWWGEATSSHLFPYISSTTLSKMRARKFVPLEAFVPTDEVAAASRHNSVKLTDQLFLSTGAVDREPESIREAGKLLMALFAWLPIVTILHPGRDREFFKFAEFVALVCHRSGPVVAASYANACRIRYEHLPSQLGVPRPEELGIAMASAQSQSMASAQSQAWRASTSLGAGGSSAADHRAGSRPQPTTKASATATASEICDRFNRGVEHTFCRRLHVCAVCRGPHRRTECTQSPNTSQAQTKPESVTH